MKQNIPILYYHFVKSPGKGATIKGLYTSLFHFEWQIKQLAKKGYNFITFEDVALGKYDEKQKNIILTFDDGCESLYFNAFPILKRYNAKAVVYVVTDSIGKRDLLWEDNENKEPISILTKPQISEMINKGIEFGSHLCRHVHLPTLTEQEMKNELVESKKYLESEFGIKVYSVAYPFGSYNANVIENAEEAGYQYGVTTKAGDNSAASNLELFRFSSKGYALRHFFYFYKLLKKLPKT